MVLLEILGVTALSGVSFAGYMGAFKRIKLTAGKLEECDVIYTQYQGPYKKIGSTYEGFLSTLKEAELTEPDTEDYYCFGIYYDDPDAVDPKDWKATLAQKIKRGPQHENFVKLNPDFHLASLPEVKNLQSSFPYRNTWSYFYAATRVYPAFPKAFAGEWKQYAPICQDKFSILEIYKNKEIIFACPVSDGRKEYFLKK